jgi:hypothetical protein
MELASPPDSVLATPMSNDFVTVLSHTFVMDLSSDILNSLEFDQSIGDHTDFFHDDDTPCPMRTSLDISDITDVAPPIVSGLAHVQTYYLGSIFEDSCSEDNIVVQQVSLVRKDAIRRSIPGRKIKPVRRNAFKRCTSNFRALVALVRQNVARRNDL